MSNATNEASRSVATALRAALARPEVVQGLADMGLEAKSSTQAELAGMQRRDHERWGPIVKAVGFKAD